MENTKSIKQVLSEALGVPSNLVEFSVFIFDELVDVIPDNQKFNTSTDEHFIFEDDEDFVIGNYKFKGIKFTFKFHGSREMEIMGMSTKNLSKVTKKFKIKTKINHGILDIFINMVVPKSFKGKDLKKFLIDNKVEIIGSFSHELKHYYDAFSKPKAPISGRVKYESLTQNRFGDIEPLNKFLHSLYFTHRIENLVRPSEFAGALAAGEVTKKGFLEFLQNYSVYQRLKEIQNFTYEDLRKSLLDDISDIQKTFIQNGIDFDGLSDEEIVDRALDLFVNNLEVWEVQSLEKRLASNMMELLTGLKGKKAKFFQKYIENMKPHGENFERYFKKQEKIFKFVATDMIKKMAKLYAMTPDVQNESIINWELWHKIRKTNSKIVTESKYFKKKS